MAIRDKRKKNRILQTGSTKLRNAKAISKGMVEAQRHPNKDDDKFKSKFSK